MPSNLQTPGVYIVEQNAFPNSVVGVPTAVPAFIGYTPQAMYNGKSYTNVAVRISSFADFRKFYCLPDPPPPADPVKQYVPQYYLVKQESQPSKEDYMVIEGTYYSILPDPDTIYYLYNSIRLFYENGGADAYIVSVGGYGPPSKAPMNAGDQLVNANVQLDALLKGLALLEKEQEPTMYICPEATLLDLADNKTLMQAMLAQSASMQTTVSIFDIIGGRNPDPVFYTDDIKTFRDNTGETGLNYGAAYYPFVGTNIMQNAGIDHTHLSGGDTTALKPLLDTEANPNPAASTILSNIENHTPPVLTTLQYHNALLNASNTYKEIIKHVLSAVDLLPASGAMAGVLTTVDNARGVWKAPANVSIADAVSLPLNLTDDQQGGLNVDAVSGKSINVIRFFKGIGILVWGARTLDGNSQDWRYINVRRTVTFIEQSCKQALKAYVFEPNTNSTWATVTAMISNFLNSVWKQGGLAGATPGEAYSVSCGLGTTMTANDILDGIMNVSIKMAVSHPAEFIVITFQQQMQQS